MWEVCFGKTGEFREVVRAFDLKGHSAGVYSFDFSNDSRRQDISFVCHGNNIVFYNKSFSN